MSLVYITHHNENIANVEDDLNAGLDRHTHYVSKFKKRLQKQSFEPNIIEGERGKKIITDSKKYKCRTMGYAETPLNPPCDFLRKNHGVKWQRRKDHVCVKMNDIPVVPRRERAKVVPKPKPVDKSRKRDERRPAHCPNLRFFKGHKHRANFVAINIQIIKSSVPKRHPPRYVDTPKGDVHALLNTGLVPQAVCLKNYGKVPCYLPAQNKMLERLRRICAADDQIQRGYKCTNTVFGPGVRKLTSSERYDILSGLKENYTDLCKSYQGLSLYTDTMAKKLRKGKIESDLRQLEQDILLIESNPVIFVSDF